MDQNIEQDFYFQDALFQMFSVGTTKKLIKMLNKNGIRYFENGHGSPFVARSEFERKPPKRQAIPTEKVEWKPNVMMKT